MRTKLQDDRGQAMAFMAIALTALVGMTAFVVDVGAWFRADRQVQVVADAAALAGAQALPEDPGEAAALAEEYATKNGGATTDTLAIESTVVPNDTIRVEYSTQTPGFFAAIFGIEIVTVSAKAAARSSNPSAAKWVAPIAVSEAHPRLRCTAPSVCDPEFEVATTLELANLHKPGAGDAAGAFGLINLERGSTGTVGNSQLGEWISTGLDKFMERGTYNSVPGAQFNSSHVREALDEKIRTGDELLFPIYRTLKKSGATAEYEIVGWVGFVVTSVEGSGSSATIHGHFTRVVWEGISSETADTPDYGVRTISLID